jgi:hypothetical protein
MREWVDARTLARAGPASAALGALEGARDPCAAPAAAGGAASGRSAAAADGRSGSAGRARRLRFRVGIVSWSRAAGRIRGAPPGVPGRAAPSPISFCGWRVRIRHGAIGASMASWLGSASRSRQVRSGRSCAGTGSSRRRGGAELVGVPARASIRDRRLRFPDRRHRLAAALVRAVLHRTRSATSTSVA